MKIYTLRLEEKDIERLKKAAGANHLPVRTMIRAWILEKLDKVEP